MDYNVLTEEFDTPLDQAMAYAAAGIKVFPVKIFRKGEKWVKVPAEKRPENVPQGQGGHNRATTDPEQIHEWFYRRHGVHVGLPCTHNGLLVLDLDIGDRGDGVEWFEGQEDEHGEVETFVVETGSGGQHIYFLHPGGEIKNRGTSDSVDIKTQGWVCAPTTRYYRRDDHYLYNVIDDSPIAEAPGWVVDYCASAPTPDPVEGEGGRNTSLSERAYRMRKAGLEVDEIYAALRVANDQLEAPLGDDEVRQIAYGKAGVEPAPDLGEVTAGLGQLLVEQGMATGEPASYAEFREAMGSVSRAGLPDVERNADGNAGKIQLATGSNVRHIVESLGMSCRFNMMLGEAELTPPARAAGGWFGEQHLEARVRNARRAVLDSALQAGIKDKNTVRDILEVIGLGDPYHPVEDWILSQEWDGVSRFEDLLSTITLSDLREQDLTRMYLRKWLVQTLEAIRGYRREKAKEHVLTFVGPQGCGKTTWLRALLPNGWVRHGVNLQLNGGTAQRDSLQEALMAPIVELGELDATFRRSDISALKSFLSQTMDVYRKAYGEDHLKRPRCTSFAGSVNDDDFLRDVTGNRRYLIVDVKELDPFHGIDMGQLWAEVNGWWEAGEDYALTREESSLQAEHAEHFRASSEPEDCFHAYFGNLGPADNLIRVAVTATQLARLVESKTDRPSLSVISRCAKEAGFEFRRQVKGKRRCWVCEIRKTDTHRFGPGTFTQLD